MTKLSGRALVLGERLFRLRAKGAAGPGMEEIEGVLLLCAAELDQLEQAQDVRAFAEVQNIGRELLATMKERDRARVLLARAMQQGRLHASEYAWEALVEGYNAAVADEPREKP